MWEIGGAETWERAKARREFMQQAQQDLDTNPEMAEAIRERLDEVAQLLADHQAAIVDQQNAQETA